MKNNITPILSLNQQAPIIMNSKEKQYLHIIEKNNQIFKVLCSTPKDVDLDDPIETNKYFDSGENLEVKEYDKLFHKIRYMSNFSNKPEDKINRAGVVFRRYVAGEFYRTTFDSRLFIYKLPRQLNQGYIFIKEEAFLWKQTYKMLQSISSIEKEYIDDREQFWCEVFYGFVAEKLLLLTTTSEYLMRETTKTAYISKLQSQNRVLQALEKNPFPLGKLTHTLMDVIIKEFDRDPTLSKKYYQPMVQARMKLVTSMKEAKSVAKIRSFGQPLEHRGRSSKPSK